MSIIILAQFLKDIINSTMFHKKHSVYAVYRLQDTSNNLPFEEVAFGSGTQWEKRITRDSKVNVEDIIWDSHAEVIANQSFRRYLISQMKNLISGTKESIFEYDRSSPSSTNTVRSSPSPCLKLRSNFRIHLYISKVPCGGAANCLNPGRSATEGTPNSTDGTPNSTESTPHSPEGTPHSTDGTPNSTESTPNSTESTPNSTESTPNSTEGTPHSTDGTPHHSSDGTPNSTEGTPNSPEGTPNSTDGTPIWGKKEGCVMEQEYSVRYVIKSCTDKIASWIKGGVQGAILHPYIGRIQIDTITIFSENKFPRKHGDARAELLKYANSDTKTKIIFTSHNRNAQVSRKKSSEHPGHGFQSINWWKEDEENVHANSDTKIKIIFTSQNRNAQVSRKKISELPGHRFLSINWWKEEENIHVFDTRHINDLQHDPSRICMSKMCEALCDCLCLNTNIDTSRHDYIKTNGLIDILLDFDKFDIVSANQSQTHIQI